MTPATSRLAVVFHGSTPRGHGRTCWCSSPPPPRNRKTSYLWRRPIVYSYPGNRNPSHQINQNDEPLRQIDALSPSSPGIGLLLSPGWRWTAPLSLEPAAAGGQSMGAAGGDREEEGVMATDFFWSYTDEPHASRRREILAKYPQIKELFGPDPLAFLKIAAVVCLQLWTATFLRDAGWLKILTVAYFFGSFLNHNLFLAIHELSHNLAFTTPSYNRWLGIFANLPIGVPMSITFQKYHLEHHRFQGVDGLDMDIPSQAEAHAVKNALSKSIWVVFQLFFYALRPLFIKPKPPGLWEFTNLAIQMALDASMVYFFGWKSLTYLILSTFVGGGMHPMAGHFISEHYVFNPDQETYSYYGPLNLMTWHVGYHNEHHDFPRIPGTRLHKVREIAPEYYNNLKSYKSWSQVIYMYIMDQTVGPFSRMKRKAPKKDS